MDILEHNRQAWNRESSDQGPWSMPVSTDMITSAKAGHRDVILTPLKPVPKARSGGSLLSGDMNPSFFLFDHDERERDGVIQVKYKLPFSEPESLDEDGLKKRKESGRALEFSHSLEAQMGGQLQAGFLIADLFGRE